MFLQQYSKVKHGGMQCPLEQCVDSQQDAVLQPAHLATVCLQMVGLKRFPFLTTLKLIDQVG